MGSSITRSDLKNLVRECLLEIISEEFIKKTINEAVQEKIVVEVNVPGSSQQSQSTTTQKRQYNKKPLQESRKPVPEDVKNKMRSIISGEGESVIINEDNNNQPSPVTVSPTAARALNAIEGNDMLKKLAADTIANNGGTIPNLG